MNKLKPKLKKNDQGMPGWNIYAGLDNDFEKVTIYPEAGTVYFELTKAKSSSREMKPGDEGK